MTKYNPDIHHRRSSRLKGYDYSQPGIYFITICAHQRECLFGHVEDRNMILNEFGQIVRDKWKWLAEQYEYVKLGEFVVMHNNFHGILIMMDNDIRKGGSRTAPTVKRKPLGRLVGAFETVSTKYINQIRKTPGMQVWQRNYYDHIIRDETSYHRIAEYIKNNPSKWQDDKYYA